MIVEMAVMKQLVANNRNFSTLLLSLEPVAPVASYASYVQSCCSNSDIFSFDILVERLFWNFMNCNWVSKGSCWND